MNNEEYWAQPPIVRYSVPGRDFEPAKTAAWWKSTAELDGDSPRPNLFFDILNAGFEEREMRIKAAQGDLDAKAWVADLTQQRVKHKAKRLAEAQQKWNDTPRFTPEQIVRRLALEEPRDSETGDCVLCGGYCSDDEMVLRHNPGCEYLHALAWVADGA